MDDTILWTCWGTITRDSTGNLPGFDPEVWSPEDMRLMGVVGLIFVVVARHNLLFGRGLF